MIKLGITGIIGSGKSVVSSIFRILEIAVYDADYNAKLLMNTSSEIKDKLILEFGQNAYTHEVLNKQYIASQIFNNEKKRQVINSIVHPIVKNDFIEWANNQKGDICAIESALLYESGLNTILDKTILVTSPENIIIERICNRDKTTKGEALKRIESQSFYKSLNQTPNYTIVNDDEHSLILQSLDIIKQIRNKW
ncbi:MAG: dephospho-CoA kinase [Bacteroidales bacterium]|nr:dephospho-CoA kinase [Bacteroidales bacterium]MDD4576838.1 dephospho-CoA kinase [Bacteroidales bacterium]